MTGGLPYESGPAGVCVRIRVTPGAGKSELAGLREDADGNAAIAVRVTANPGKGKATAAAMETLARALRVPPSRLSLKCGGRSRLKLIQISGEAAEIERALAQLLNKQRGD